MERLPLFVVTGFLGSGKTTLLRRLLREPSDATTGIVVNEFGEIGLDHRLLVHAKEHLELVEGGCICCARRQDIGEAIHDLVRRSRLEAGGTLTRAVIETTGLADPTPIVSAVGRDPWMRSNVRLSRVICVLDAVNGLRSLEEHREALRQLAVADTVIVTKMDMSRAADWSDIVRAVRSVTPDARILDAQAPDFDPGAAFAAEDASAPPRPDRFVAEDVTHSANWSSFVLRIEESIDWPAFTLWLSALLHAHGSRILRVKGVIRTTASRAPLVIHGVQHVVHPPHHLNPDEDAGESGYIVFITSGVDKAAIEASLGTFLSRTRAIEHRRHAEPAQAQIALSSDRPRTPLGFREAR